MSLAREVVLGTAALNTPRRKDKKKKKIIGRNAKKVLHIFMDESKLAFLGWEQVQEPWNFANCEAYIEWCHISKGFLHSCYRLHHITDKVNLHHYKWPIFRKRCIEMCQHIYNIPSVERKWCMPRWCLEKK